ncbi:MAG: lysylphosphatidylglycerol synthase domain-containing protein, partial [Coriobacteriales bacterium]|nr:lysylphosphatidylglycerol synthase domain-containing protein [Coriobacteriales bacterium]
MSMRRGSIRILLIGVLMVVALAVVLLRGDQLMAFIATMESGSIIPLVLAIAAQFGKYISQSYAYAASFKTVGEPSAQAREMLSLVFGSYFMNVIAPSFNTAGLMLVVDSARKRGIPAGRATSAVLLMQISVITGFLVIMVVGFAVLQVAGHLSPVWFFLGMVVIFFAGAMVAVMYIGYKNPSTLAGLLTPIERLVNRLSRRFRKGRELDPWVQQVVDSFSEAGGKIRE